MLFSLQASSQSPQDSPVTSLWPEQYPLSNTRHSFLQRTGLPSTYVLNSKRPPHKFKSSIYTLYNYKTLFVFSILDEWTRTVSSQRCQQAKADTDRSVLTLTEVPFHHSNAKVTQSLQILSKAYNKLSKTPNCDKNTFCVCAMLMLQIICIWSNLNAGSKTTFPLISQDCFHCTHLHQQDMLLLCSFPPPQAPVQVQKSWPLQCTRYELIPFLNRTQQQSGNRHSQGSFLWKELQGQMVTMKL